MKRNDVAIVGMSCVFPGAADVDTFWQNIINKVDCTQTVPPGRIDQVHFDTASSGVDRFYCNRGGFIPDVEFNPGQFGILPLAVEGTEPDHLITLSLAHSALEDAGVFEKGISLEKTGIIIGKGNYAGPGATRAIEIVRTGEQIVNVLKDLFPHLDTSELDKIKKEFQLRKGRFGPDTAMGLIPNLVASLVANRLNLGGVAYTLDAACASSLLAVDHAVRELSSGRCNMVIAGGVHVGQNAAFWSIFNQLGALSKKGKISPFDENADGLLIGEGCGFVVLKKLEDAVAAKDRIYAVLKGVGVSSDGSGTSVMSPSVKGQLIAMRQAWEMAGTIPGNIGYIEAHGTGTPLGDKTELETLLQFFGHDPAKPRAGIGTVKSNIGHAMPACGIAGLIKTAMALYHGILPPTLHCNMPLAQMSATRFAPVQEARDWDTSGLPRLAGVNAFGFGGINAHAVLESYTDGDLDEPAKKLQKQVKTDKVLLLARHSHEALINALQNNESTPGEGKYRIAVFDPTPERRQKAVKIAARNIPWRNKQDIWFTNEPLLQQGGKIAFVFPGLDGLVAAETDSIADYFNIRQENMVRAPGLLNDALEIFNKSSIIDTALKKLGIWPAMAAGHSLGEWLASRSSGLVEEASVLQLLKNLNPETYELKDSRFIAVGMGIDQLQPFITQIDRLYLSNDNCPQQVILCGSNAAIDELVPILKRQQIFHQILPFQSGFHSPFIAERLDIILEGMSQLKFNQAQFPLWSATTLELYPDDIGSIMKLNVEHLIKPVRFRELTERLFAEGARVFIQVGSGGLTGFIDDTLRGNSISTVSSGTSLRPGIAQLQRVLAALFIEGGAIDMKLMGYEKPVLVNGRGIALQLGLPLIHDFPGLKKLVDHTGNPLRKKVAQIPEHSLMQVFNKNVEEMAEIQSELIQAFQNRERPAAPATRVVPPVPAGPVRVPFIRKLDISLDNSPYLMDHCLMRQPKDWKCVDDMDPVIPMTMIFEVFGEIAVEHAPGELVQKISNIKVFQWISVIRPFRETISGEWKSEHLLRLNLERFAEAEVLLAKRHAQPPVSNFDTGRILNIQRTPEQIYKEHMFHGHAYQGIKKLIAVGDKGIRGIIEGGTGKGSLLDNAGQLFGLWLQLTLPKDRIAFPVKIQEIAFFFDLADQHGSFECTCQLTELTDEFATADFIIKRNDQVWAIVTGWQNRRMGIDEPLWRVSMSPLNNYLSEEISPGIFMFHHAYSRVVSWNFVFRRYFGQEERKYYESLPPNKRKEWMISRIAVKDAVKNLLIRTKQEAHYPIEFEVRSDELHRPYLQGQMTEGIQISIAHKGTDAVAIAQYGGQVGIDIEHIEERSEGFYELVFSESERSLLSDREKSEWATRFWVAKEAYGKYLGKGLQGNPKAYIIEEIRGEELKINDIFIQTIKHKNYIIGWTQS
jgi:acyl transferase domain-containing protein/phosphopantetheinyl transferase